MAIKRKIDRKIEGIIENGGNVASDQKKINDKGFFMINVRLPCGMLASLDDEVIKRKEENPFMNISRNTLVLEAIEEKLKKRL